MTSSYAALEPKLGKQTLTIHHDKHHAKYVTVANQVRIVPRLSSKFRPCDKSGPTAVNQSLKA
jgi:superoxide dismutase